MAPSPNTSESRSRLIREMSQSLRESRRDSGSSSSSSQLPFPTSPARESVNNTLPSAGDLDLGTGSSFDPTADGAFESTRKIDETTQNFPNIRSSAQRMKYWQPPQPAQNVNTSMVEQEFQDFSDEHSGDESKSIEMSRAPPRSLRNTPSKIGGDLSRNNLSIADDSLYNLSEARNRPRPTPRRSADGVERGSLRRDAQLRRAASLPQKELELASTRATRNNDRVSPEKAKNNDRRRNTLAQFHARASEDDTSFIDERPPTVNLSVKNTRFGNARSRQASGLQNDFHTASSGGLDRSIREVQTPQRPTIGTPRSAPGNATNQSFMLPDLPNLTELVSGVFKDGTPVFSRSAKARSRFSAAPIPSRLKEESSKHYPIENVPVPADEKALFAALQLLKEKLSQMEHEKTEADKKIEDYEAEVAGLKAELRTQEHRKGRDSALGSTDSESNKRDNWRVEKMKLESAIDALRGRVDRAERKNSLSEIATKRITEERDNAVTQLGVAYYNSEELKGERDALQAENDTLRNEVDTLRIENEELQIRLAQFEERSEKLQKRASRGDNAVRKENETLHAELEKFQAIQAEQAKLKGENEALKAQVNQIRQQREEDTRRRNRKEAELRSRLDRRDETIQQLQDMTQEEVNDTLRNENEELRIQLAQLAAQRDDDARDWAKREARLQRKVEKSQDTAREAQDITREIMSVRRTGSQKRASKGDDRPTQTEVRNSQTTGREEPTSTFRSKSKSRPAPAKAYRSASAPETRTQQDMDISDVESTTDLDAMSHVRNPGRNDEPTGNTTELSFMGHDEVARLRKALEEERAAARKNVSQTRQDDTTRSQRTQPVPRKSSMKDLTNASVPMDITESKTGRILSGHLLEPTSTIPEKQDTERSILGRSTRRRRPSGPGEMTSAFILPDITMQAKTPLTPEEPHESTNCTVCRKTSCTEEHSVPIDIPEPVPVSERMPDDVDATMRPSQPAPLALATVIKELQDELAHLNLQKAAYDSLLRGHDASLSKRKRKAIEGKIADLLEAISTKSDQIYALYDVVEGQKAAGQLHEDNDNNEDMGEKEIEETLMSVGIDPEEMREKTQHKPVPAAGRNNNNGKSKGPAKKVVIEDGGHSADESEELPWEGISDSESLPDLMSGRAWKRKTAAY
ncbi:uncharacterized protein K452DRAFT_313159 [Aplosporella prunicola CBS 121167]|uniref:Cep57 centrosome microtubule-binding domain-containing protein n=1 Tax=Aplosporella prunicola CBS 121167 TaxID=1176127 RepID=A0A6A6AZ46_9PEZI|nr:uncharacterized protein K452DRAFT_313159 [Aplosporella prunicola CBS 121167]KAF2136463.1 hypothetical protein K452DRAFT_313159 [Aplosporella prunicola CBS 121167]